MFKSALPESHSVHHQLRTVCTLLVVRQIQQLCKKKARRVGSAPGNVNMGEPEVRVGGTYFSFMTQY